MKRLLVKDGSRRPNAGQAFLHPFLDRFTVTLSQLYEELVVSPWVAHGNKDNVVFRTTLSYHETQGEIPSCQDLENMETSVETPLIEIDGNCSETREKKRQLVHDENNQSHENGDGEIMRKKRRIICD